MSIQRPRWVVGCVGKICNCIVSLKFQVTNPNSCSYLCTPRILSQLSQILVSHTSTFSLVAIVTNLGGMEGTGRTAIKIEGVDIKTSKGPLGR